MDEKKIKKSFVCKIDQFTLYQFRIICKMHNDSVDEMIEKYMKEVVEKTKGVK